MRKIKIVSFLLVLSVLAGTMLIFSIENNAEAATAYSQIVTENSKTYMKVDGKPFLYYGVKIRLDDYIYGDMSKISDCWKYFQKASELGFKMVQVVVPWCYIEKSEGVYEYNEFLHKIIDWCNQYDLYLFIEWFGSNVVSYPNLAAWYVQNDRTRFPRWTMPAPDNRPTESFDFSNHNVINKEKAVLQAVMNEIASYDTNKRVMGIHIEGEPDGSMSTYHVRWCGGQRDSIINNLLSPLGDIVHNSARNVVVSQSVEWSTYMSYFNSNQDGKLLLNKSGIDTVGPDPYAALGDLNEFNKYMYDYDEPGNIPHPGENGGQYKNLVNLILSTFDRGGGYIVYELITDSKRKQNDGYDLGVLRSDWNYRDGTQNVPYALDGSSPGPELNTYELKDFHELIYKADKRIAKAVRGKSAAFNLNNWDSSVDETKMVGSRKVQYKSSVGGEAFAFEDENGDVILMSLKNGSTFTFDYSLDQTATASVGYFNNSNVWVQQSTRSLTNCSITLNAKEVVKIPSTAFKAFNVALSANVSVSTEAEPGQNQTKTININDNDVMSRWDSKQGVTWPTYVNLEWSGNQTVNRLGITGSGWNQATGIRNFDLQYWNGSTWVNILTNQNMSWYTNDTTNPETRKFIFPAVTTSKLRLKINSGNYWWGWYSIGEIEVWSGSTYNLCNAASWWDVSDDAEPGQYGSTAWNIVDNWNSSFISKTGYTKPSYVTVWWPANITANKLVLKNACYNTDQAITNFDLQYWNGSNWVNILTSQSVIWTKTGYGLETKSFEFANINTSQMRLKINNANNTWGSYSLTQMEIWGNN